MDERKRIDMNNDNDNGALIEVWNSLYDGIDEVRVSPYRFGADPEYRRCVSAMLVIQLVAKDTVHRLGGRVRDDEDVTHND